MITYAELTNKHNFLTNREYLSLHGTLSLNRIEALIEMEDVIRGQEGVLNYLDEACGAFSKEGFLDDTINNLRVFLKRLSGYNRNDLSIIIDHIEALQTSILQGSEYGMECLKMAEGVLYTTL